MDSKQLRVIWKALGSNPFERGISPQMALLLSQQVLILGSIYLWMGSMYLLMASKALSPVSFQQELFLQAILSFRPISISLK